MRMLVLMVILGVLGFARTDDSQGKLKAINERIDNIQEKLEALKNEKKSVLNEVTRLELEQEKARVEFNRTELQWLRMREKLERNNREKERLEKRIAASKETLKSILRVIYKTGEMGYIKFFVFLENFEQLFQNYRLFTVLINYKFNEIRTIRGDVERLQQIRSEMQQQAASLEELKNQKNLKVRQLSSRRGEKLAFINRINQERELQANLLDGLQEEAERLNNLLDRSVSNADLAIGDLAQLRGRIPWPLPGTVVASFGKKKSARFDTYTFNNGIEIRPTRGNEIHAVLDGEVIFADYFTGYGNVIIVQHKRTFHTLYGHCRDFLKKKGDPVARGEVIATVGDTGGGELTTLYFEIRENLKALDPLQWLSGK